MTELLTAAQMRARESAAMDSGAVTGLALMKRAGRGVVEAVFAEWPVLANAPHRAVVLCGPGNNGGDGFVVARLLRDRGWQVTLFLYGDADRLPPDALACCREWQRTGDVRPLDDPEDVMRDGFDKDAPDLIVDAMFGTGLTRPLTGAVAQTFAEIDRWKRAQAVPVPCVAVDIPSGLCSDSGRVMGGRRMYDLTVTFHSAKPGHYLSEGPQTCGSVRVVEIGIPRHDDSSQNRPDEVVRLTGPPLGLGKHGAQHKYAHGHALILSGVAGRSGAARLAARGALRIGAGLVTMGVPGSAQQEVACQITALMLRRAGTPGELRTALEDARINALCLGPGLGVGRASDLVSAALAARRATVLDADALTAFAEVPEALFGHLHEACVLTPHDGEFARLFPDLGARLRDEPSSGPAFSRVDAARAAARRAGCVVLLKGPDTVIAGPDGRCSVNTACYDRAAPWLATAGAGDVLAGFLTGLLARGLAPVEAAETAAWLHVDCARRFGPGLIAEDLPEALPAVLQSLQSRQHVGFDRT
ncbi:bifunctional ADP-dependent NAD(P)H-hydrate dehydratase/NAD(P)H-hydrate epimerase [Roseovarius sp. TE539]|uniref:NAD(P)H-hydrate dehydratase n=1 Tax=Roseovarius sp. TE539 TaxID=2249812 RepID=UPI000DDF0447|nr:NAD(P)H-hydrate dehydratase [Roseovarius sp. TE539]RBI67890.1 bifunctional ADP-dependent NAD(P)H-hydrate dehydratase/NAD(P)H-hydrate epimerase [Roseovarius sp. TE539]